MIMSVAITLQTLVANLRDQVVIFANLRPPFCEVRQRGWAVCGDVHKCEGLNGYFANLGLGLAKFATTRGGVCDLVNLKGCLVKMETLGFSL
jgi:hypothetical protein